ncbi:hypothetical protein ACIBG7_26420 [Nonomuraea sp. NPDC050328]|uniref:hypothetical protein n=1 Tax=Nonomuraea sp. NPDC050328 TaxID=3364361 RepID=UPI0037A426B3
MRVWSVVTAVAALLLAGAVPARAEAGALEEERPTVSVVAGEVQPPSYAGVCAPGVPFTTTATITAGGPGLVTYQWADVWAQWNHIVFTEAGTHAVTGMIRHYDGFGPRTRTLIVKGANQAQASVSYQVSCVDPVLSRPQIQPAPIYVGRCGTDVVHTVSAQISSPIAQTVRYRWSAYDDRPLPGGLGDEREIVFTEPGTKTVSAPFQRQPVPQYDGGSSIQVQVLTPAPMTGANTQEYYRTVCVSAEFTEMTRTAGNCRTGTPYKYVMRGYVESSAMRTLPYAWARYDSLEGVWTRDAWTSLSFAGAGRQNVSRTWLSADGGSGVWRLEVLGTDGTVVSQSRPYSIPCV